MADVFCLAMIDRGEQEVEKTGREQVVKQNLVKEKERTNGERSGRGRCPKDPKASCWTEEVSHSIALSLESRRFLLLYLSSF